ncbi:MAG: hypothetical protein QME48_04355 [bacterium]|uniref:Uncharacterized protein n=2 Tax=Bacteria candidate phyla TaxID=1783234 RepID=A0A117M6P3_UNCT6|nr:MAG: hypothetical protein XD76_1029 [candidate division TA06 bacterium 32_111]KUK87297.1 MAG: hypothetical protein XE03_0905 [candidate division TA06 bacterium 34_109]MDI6700445.1 hypothetical protein [bacterium]HAF07569.1 hypothetical protein [candidate division WOR-3 bacterium]HCP16818.1 hypothetical protein [candidate division WOR-3 bacterium]
MNFFLKLSKIDRRFIYLFIALVVVLPLILKPKFPVVVSKPVQDVYDYIEKLPEGSNVLISIDYDAASMPEQQPFLEALLRQLFKNKLKPILIVQWQLGAPLGTMGLEKIAKEMGAEYGKDYINLGYRPGYVAQMVGIGKEIRDFFKVDYKNIPLDSFPMMKNVHNYNDIALLVGLEAGATYLAWIEYAGGRFKQKIALALNAVSAPDAYYFYQSGQIVGLVGGMKGAAEYEVLVDKPDLAVAGMASQSYSHLVIILFIILGNIAYFIEKGMKNKEGGK